MHIPWIAIACAGALVALRGYFTWRRRRSRSPKPTRRRKATAQASLGALLHQYRYDLRAFSRNRQARYFTLVLPLVFLVILVGVFGNRTVVEHGVSLKTSTYEVPGIVALGVVAASFVNLIVAITAQREFGILKRRRSTPVAAWVLIGGRTLTALTVSAATAALLIVVGATAFGVALNVGAIPALCLTVVVGALSFGCLAYAVSTFITSAESAQPIVQLIVLPLYFISGVFIPNPSLPSWLNDIARAFPIEHLAAALRSAFDPTVAAGTVAGTDLVILAAWGIVGLTVALRRFVWLPRASVA